MLCSCRNSAVINIPVPLPTSSPPSETEDCCHRLLRLGPPWSSSSTVPEPSHRDSSDEKPRGCHKRAGSGIHTCIHVSIRPTFQLTGTRTKPSSRLIFSQSSMVYHQLSCLDGSRYMLRTHERHFAETNLVSGLGAGPSANSPKIAASRKSRVDW